MTTNFPYNFNTLPQPFISSNFDLTRRRTNSFDDGLFAQTPKTAIRSARTASKHLLPSLYDSKLGAKRVLYSDPSLPPQRHHPRNIRNMIENLRTASLDKNQYSKKKPARRGSVQERIHSFEILKHSKLPKQAVAEIDENIDVLPSVKNKIAEFERRSSIDSIIMPPAQVQIVKAKIYPFETLISDPVRGNAALLDVKFDEIRRLFSPDHIGQERIIPINILGRKALATLSSSKIVTYEPLKRCAFVSGIGSRREPKRIELVLPREGFSDVFVCLHASLRAGEQIEDMTCLMAVNANRFHLHPRFPGIYLGMDISACGEHARYKDCYDDLRFLAVRKPRIARELEINSDEYLTAEEDTEMETAGEPRTQSIVVKGKREHETFAVANLEAPVQSKETVNKTIVVGVKQRSVQTEKVAATVKLDEKAPLRCPETSEEEEEHVSGQTTELVEEQLREIGILAENIANSNNRKLRESDVMSTSASSSFVRLDNIDEDMAKNTTGPLLKCVSTPRVFNLDNAIEIKPPSKKVFPTMSLEARVMVDKLQKGLADFTTTSQDRLQRWKNKLQTTGRRQKDTSEPPPMHRNCFPKSQPSKEEEPQKSWKMSDSPQNITYPRPLHSSKSLQNAGSMGNVPSLNNQLSLDMEHRTLKSKENSASQKDVAAFEIYDNVFSKSSAPPRLPPISGVRPDGTDLVRPIAFRPVAPSVVDPAKRQSAGTFRTEFERSRLGPLSASLNGTPPVPQTAVPTKPRGMHQPSTSFNHFPRTSVENEYDTVNDYYEKHDAGSNSDYSTGAGSLGRKPQFQTVQIGSPGAHNKKSFTSSTSSSASRHSSGVHVTPSPSDSGIVDYESIIRDKENELREVRNTMEHNEEIIIKVYQEKERSYRNEIQQLRNRLSASEKGENALRAQLSSCQRQTDVMRASVEGLLAEKRDMEKRCEQLERDVAYLKSHQCAECVRRINSRAVPVVRMNKELTPNEDLRDEVSLLRKEVATLRDALGSMHINNNNQTISNGTSRIGSEPKLASARDRLI